jgi:hypothetical protein
VTPFFKSELLGLNGTNKNSNMQNAQYTQKKKEEECHQTGSQDDPLQTREKQQYSKSLPGNNFYQ